MRVIIYAFIDAVVVAGDAAVAAVAVVLEVAVLLPLQSRSSLFSLIIILTLIQRHIHLHPPSSPFLFRSRALFSTCKLLSPLLGRFLNFQTPLSP